MLNFVQADSVPKFFHIMYTKYFMGLIFVHYYMIENILRANFLKAPIFACKILGKNLPVKILFEIFLGKKNWGQKIFEWTMSLKFSITHYVHKNISRVLFHASLRG